MSNQQPSLIPSDPIRWHESVLSTRSLSYMSTISALGTHGLPSPLVSRNASIAHLYPPSQSNMDEDSEHELEMTIRKEKTIQQEILPDSVARSLLFTLPQEIRDKIWEYCLTTSRRSTIEWPAASPYISNISPAVLRTCKVIFLEASPILYAHNHFAFTHPTDANIFTRAVSSPVYSSLISHVSFHIRTQDTRLWMTYLSSNNLKRSLKHDFPSLQHLTIRYKSTKWSHSSEPQENLKKWTDDKHLTELLEGLGHVYYPGHDKSRQPPDMQASNSDVDTMRVLASLQLLRCKVSMRETSPPVIRVICMCRVRMADFQTLTAPQAPPQFTASTHHTQTGIPVVVNLPGIAPQADGGAASTSLVNEGDDFTAFTTRDLQGRATRITIDSTGSSGNGDAAWVARTVYANKKNILLALEIFAYEAAR